jgi:RNA polymerase sigma factor (TIGR02999 family)
MADVTSLLRRWTLGEQEALGALVPAVYLELRKLARRELRRERGGHTLQATALVHEAFLRLVPQQHKDWQNREHFFAVCAQLMRQVLVDHARRRQARKRDAGELRIGLEEVDADAGGAASGPRAGIEMLDLDRALTELATIDATRARIVEMRYFAGMTVREIGVVTRRPEWDVKKDWLLARTWLRRYLKEAP